MKPDMVRQIADAVMYEGYMLYPYRHSSVKNRQRWTFGGLYPERRGNEDVEPASMQSQILIECDGEPEVTATVRFLHLLQRADGVQEGEPREIGVGPFVFEGTERQRRIVCHVELTTEQLAPSLHRLTLRVTNRTDSQDPLTMMASTHAILKAVRGSFYSLTDPPDAVRDAAAQCVNTGVWPILVGQPGSRDQVLVSPIILSDYPEIAPESPGDLFDAAEIDEILSLRILTLTDGEKAEMRAADPWARALLERTEALSPEQMMRLHGMLRKPRVDFKPGDKVRLHPRKKSDIMDIALAGQIAEIEAVETDYEEHVHLAVVLDDDPGRDLGMLRQPGHRFFFSPDEVELLTEQPQ
jgi:hypothetical protein